MSKLKQIFSTKSVPKAIGIIIAAIAGAYILFYVGCFLFGMLVLGADILLSKKQTYTDVENYSRYIGESADEKFSSKWGMDESIFPTKITDTMKVDDFSFTYYNPWDAEYVGYLTVTYPQVEFNRELERLSEKSMDYYKGLYKVTGEPQGYTVLAMDSNIDFGFVYAITPNSESTSITYVEVIFPSKLEMKLDKYLPQKYQLSGMDVARKHSGVK